MDVRTGAAVTDPQIDPGSGQEVVAWREIPPQRHYTVPADQAALLVRQGEADRILPPGRHTVRSIFQPPPEIYRYKTTPQFFPIWITDLSSADGKAANLGWRIQVKVVDAHCLWRRWLHQQAADAIPLPGGQVSARLADKVQEELMQRNSLGDLRGDREVRRQVAGKLSLLLRDELQRFGLQIAAEFDPQQLRIQTAADLAAAAAERDALARMRADSHLQTQLEVLQDVEVVTYRLREWLEGNGATLDDPTLARIAQAVVAGANPTAGMLAAMQAATAPATLPPASVEPPLPPPVNRWHMVRRLGQYVGVGTLLIVLTLLLITFLRPELITPEARRNQTMLWVIGVATVGLVATWIIDQVMRWEAHREAQAMLAAAQIEQQDLRLGRLQLRHILWLFGALLGVASVAVALWLPEYQEILRIGAASVGVLGAAYAIRIDYLHNVEQANLTIAQAQRRIASAQISASEQARRLAQRKATLQSELAVISHRLEASSSLIYRTLRNRRLSARLHQQQASVDALLPRVHQMATGVAASAPEAWQAVERQITQIETATRRCTQLAQDLYVAAQQNAGDACERLASELELAVQELDDELKRWQAVPV